MVYTGIHMNPVVHFELPADDQKRAGAFYSGVFGWKITQYGPEMDDYVVVQTDETDEKGMLKETNRINGGIFKRMKPGQGPSVVIAVDDLREAMKKVESAGGKIIGAEKPGEPIDIPGIGLYISIEDTEGNKVGMLQPSPMM